MLLKIAHEVPRGPGWAFEAKYDGYRAIVYISKGRVRIQSRSLRDMTGHYPELSALGRVYSGRELILDGEVVAFEADGRPCFQSLQARAGRTEFGYRESQTGVPISFVAFDVLFADGRQTTTLPYESGREILESLAVQGPNWQTPSIHVGEGEVRPPSGSSCKSGSMENGSGS
jgi:bifunctional non-homologous end joining protein LigD